MKREFSKWESEIEQVVFDGPLAHENSQWSFAAKAMVQQEGKGIAAQPDTTFKVLQWLCLWLVMQPWQHS